MNDPAVWGPKYWYVLHMMAFNYPQHPNKVTKKKYYDTIMNFPLFLPNAEIGNRFSRMLDKYPVTPYLDSRESFIKWTHFIHNRVNEALKKPTFSYANFIDYYNKPREENEPSWIKTHKNIIIISIMLIIFTLLYKLL